MTVTNIHFFSFCIPTVLFFVQMQHTLFLSCWKKSFFRSADLFSTAAPTAFFFCRCTFFSASAYLQFWWMYTCSTQPFWSLLFLFFVQFFCTVAGHPCSSICWLAAADVTCSLCNLVSADIHTVSVHWKQAFGNFLWFLLWFVCCWNICRNCCNPEIILDRN